MNTAEVLGAVANVEGKLDHLEQLTEKYHALVEEALREWRETREELQRQLRALTVARPERM